MRLVELASLFTVSRIIGDPDTDISGIETDSRKVKPGDLFICLPGHTVDGHQFAAQAVQQGAKALVVERDVDVPGVPKLVVKDSRFAMAVISNHFFGYPSQELKLIGVTGTNGKTTTTFLIEHILRNHGFRTGLMGTIQMKIGDCVFDVKNTTPDALELQKNFRRMADIGTDYCVMEVSSHALEQGRVKGCDFRTALFTNLTQDHLDYHRTMDKYREAKGLLFARLGNTFSRQASSRKFAVLNADDPASSYFQKQTSAEVITYGIDNAADVRAENIRMTGQGTEFTVKSFAGEARVALQLFGRFNVYNALGAIAATLVEGVPLSVVTASLEQVKGVPGRFESVREGQDFLVIVDYAHTPDSLENVLKTITDFAAARIICVVGCGGDRDRGKRPIMAQIAARYSDYTIITSDNPRSEDPEQIMREMEKGLIDQGVSRQCYELIADRKKAIEKAVEMASPKDVVLIAGKGHETYQEIQGVRHDFDDRLVAKNAIRRIRLDQTHIAPPAEHD